MPTLAELQKIVDELNQEHDQLVAEASQNRQHLHRLRQRFELASSRQRDDLEAEIGELANQVRTLDDQLNKVRQRLALADRDLHDQWWRARATQNHIEAAQNRLKPGGEHSQAIQKLTQEFERQLAALQLGIERDERTVADQQAKLQAAIGGVEVDLSREPQPNHRLVGGATQRTRYVVGGIYTGI